MKNKLLLLIISILFFECNIQNYSKKYSNKKTDHARKDIIIKGQEYNVTLYITNQTNAIIENCNFTNIKGHGLVIRNSKNIYISKCNFDNISEMGILLPEDTSNENITIDYCTISNIGIHGVHVTQRDYSGGAKNPNFKLLNCTIHDTGIIKQWPGHDHSVYIQSNDFLIEGNIIYNSHSGEAISVRNCGIIRKNICYNNYGSCIGYFNDHMKGGDILIIENNICYDNDNNQYGANNRHLIELVYDQNLDHSSYCIYNFIIRFNTIVSFDANIMCISGNPEFLNKNLEVYGNLAINTQNGSIFPLADFYTNNYTSNSLDGFINSTIQPYDFHLTDTHPARNTASIFTDFPEDDIDNDIRNAGFLDPGADQYNELF